MHSTRETRPLIPCPLKRTARNALNAMMSGLRVAKFLQTSEETRIRELRSRSNRETVSTLLLHITDRIPAASERYPLRPRALIRLDAI